MIEPDDLTCEQQDADSSYWREEDEDVPDFMFWDLVYGPEPRSGER